MALRKKSGALQAFLPESILAAGSDGHVSKLTDLIASIVPHDLITVVRYSATERPEFVSHRKYSDAMVRKYLEAYYVFDPFYARWRKNQKPGVVALASSRARGPYIAEFLSQSRITDEIGVLLPDGEGWCLGIFLDRKKGRFSKQETARLKAHYRVISAIHASDLKLRKKGFRRTARKGRPGAEPATSIMDSHWPSLSPRERDIVRLMLAGHPTAGIAKKLGLSPGTVKNHRRNIYAKLDITTERELFLQYIESRA